ncbi:hypothetical protein GCM10010222_18130 [Streptomyces tanashiensis]|nr:hypothetical protein GCM10010222_18130 [Streptomyces tanashiensis]
MGGAVPVAAGEVQARVVEEPGADPAAAGVVACLDHLLDMAGVPAGADCLRTMLDAERLKRFDGATRPDVLSIDHRRRVTNGRGSCFARNMSVNLRLEVKRFDSSRSHRPPLSGLNGGGPVSGAARRGTHSRLHHRLRPLQVRQSTT